MLMTNTERQRRHLCDSGICSVCKGGEETIIHIIRDCPAMSGIWTRLVPAQKRVSFSLSLYWNGCMRIWEAKDWWRISSGARCLQWQFGGGESGDVVMFLVRIKSAGTVFLL